MSNDDPQKTVGQLPPRTDAMLHEFFRGEMPVALESDVPPFRRPPVTASVRTAVAGPAPTPARSTQRMVVVVLSLVACAALAIVVSGLPGDDAKPSSNIVIEERDSEMGGMPVSSGDRPIDDESGISDPEHVEIDFPPPESPKRNHD